MRTIFLWLFLIAFGFVLGAGVGFKVLEGISTDLVIEATKNTSAQFQQAYSGSAAQKKVQEMIEQQKEAIAKQINAGLKAYLTGLIQ